MNNLVIATTCLTSKSFPQVRLLAESLRDFGGEFANKPLILLLPDQAKGMNEIARDTFNTFNIQVKSFALPEEARSFPLASLVYAAAELERKVRGDTDLLVWTLPDTLVLKPPKAFSLPAGVKLGYRPVHHTLVGSIYDNPPDKFWSLIYEHCSVPHDRLFPMETCVRDHVIRPYFNAGMLVVRPEDGLLTMWRDQFESLYRHPDIDQLYQIDIRDKIFIHQAVLSAVILKMYAPEILTELPEIINYPLHLHHEYPHVYRVGGLGELITCRYKDTNLLKDILKRIHVEENLKKWLDARINLPG